MDAETAIEKSSISYNIESLVGDVGGYLGICLGWSALFIAEKLISLFTSSKTMRYVKTLISGSSHIRSILIGVEYQNCRQTFVVYLRFAIWMGQIQSKLIYIFL